MKKYVFTFFIVIVGSFLCKQKGLAFHLTPQCKKTVSVFDRPLFKETNYDCPIIINANRVNGNDLNKRIIFNGNVDIFYGDSHLKAHEVQLHPKKSKNKSSSPYMMDVLGNFQYENTKVILNGLKGLVNLDNKDLDIWKGNYQILKNKGYGKADFIKQRNINRFTILENGSFTSCPIKSKNIWNMEGRKIIYDHKKNMLKIWHALFRLGSIPIFYSPYLQLPTGDKRHSGFLIPYSKFSTLNHFEFYFPYYITFTPNVDLTIIPSYLSRSGNIMLENELRYLLHSSNGLIGSNYLFSKRALNNWYSKEINRHQWLLFWKHSGTIYHSWRCNINYTKVGDLNYFKNFYSRYGSATDNYTRQILNIGYIKNNSNVLISTKQFQIFSKERRNNYAVKPQLDFNWNKNSLKPFQFHVYGQIANFINKNAIMPQSTRLHLEPDINLVWFNDWASISAVTKIIATHYQQRNFIKYNEQHNANLEKSINRVLQQFKIEGKITLERSINWLENYVQTLEPKIQYLYVPYHNHKKIYNYDSSYFRSDGYNDLFRERIYGGLDRISSMNRIIAGIKTCIYDNTAVKRLDIAFGQLYRFTESRIDDDYTSFKRSKKTKPIIWIGDTYWRITNCWGLRSKLQYDTRFSNITTGSSTIEYFRDENSLIQLNYRYSNPSYLQVVLPSNNTPYYKEGVSQIGASASWPISNRWLMSAAYYYNFEKNKLADQMLGLQYTSCCYAIRISYEKKIRGLNFKNSQIKYDSIIGLNTEIRGLNSNYNSNTKKMLRLNVFPYQNYFQ